MTSLLRVDQMRASYGQVPVLWDVSLEVGSDELVAVVGPNGAGKTTLLRAISGLAPCTAEVITFKGAQLLGLAPHQIVARGLVMVPEGGRLFPFMTVLENLELGAFNARARPALKASIEEVFTLFPLLAERRQQLAGRLSGGERQLCAIARALMSRPQLLMLDEPSLGLSPLMVERVFDLLLSLVRSKAIAILLVEQNAIDALAIAARGYVMERGKVAKSGAGKSLLMDPQVQRAYLGL